MPGRRHRFVRAFASPASQLVGRLLRHPQCLGGFFEVMTALLNCLVPLRVVVGTAVALSGCSSYVSRSWSQASSSGAIEGMASDLPQAAIRCECRVLHRSVEFTTLSGLFLVSQVLPPE